MAHATQGVPRGRVHRIRDQAYIPISSQVTSTQPARDVPAAPTARSILATPPASLAAHSCPAQAVTSEASPLRAAQLPLQGPPISPALPATRPNTWRGSHRQGKTYVVFEGLAPGLYNSWYVYPFAVVNPHLITHFT